MTTSPQGAMELLGPWVRWTLGDPAPDPQAALDALRAALPGPLPEDYAAVLLATNHAVSLESNEIDGLEPPCPPIPGQFTHLGPAVGLGILYGLGALGETCRDVAATWDSMGYRMPKGLVPIGDTYGDQICIDLSEAGWERVHYWWHEGDPGPDDTEGYPGRGNTFLLAHSFTDLCARLRPRPPLEPDPRWAQARITWHEPPP